jgi:hypothetical protein
MTALVQPLLFCALLAAGLSLCLYLFVSAKAELRAVVRARQVDHAQIRELAGALDETRLRVQHIEAALRDIEAQTGMLVAPSETKSGLNLSARTQVLRMHRAGTDVPGIAASLHLPRAEVELLIKVQRIALDQI